MDASSSRISASLCSGCGQAIDPLRAGHVAILEGAFRYFCDAACKGTFVEVTSRRDALDALTAAPPVVASGLRPAQALTANDEPAAPAAPAEEADAGLGETLDEAPREVPARFAALASPCETGERGIEVPVSTLRSPPLMGEAEGDADADADADEHGEAKADADADEHGEAKADADADEHGEAKAAAGEHGEAKAAAEEKASGEGREEAGVAASVMAVVPSLGIALGVLAVVVTLAGEGGAAFRFPFAIAAAAVVVLCTVVRPRDASNPSLLLVVGPVVLAVVGASLSFALGDARAEGHAAYLGLAAAAVLLVDVLVRRSSRDVADSRARIASALALRVRVVRGEMTAEIDAAHVKPGEQVFVEAGEVIGVDGIVAAGEAEVAPWLDSPVVLAKREGDAVVAGASIVSGRLRITTTFAGADRAWLKLGQSNAGRIDVAAPLVMLVRRMGARASAIAAVLVGGATYASNGAWADVLIGASAGSCAIAGFGAVAAAALAHARGHAAAQRYGIVYKDAEAFDTAARVEVAVVCSRGTILLGEPEIVVIEAVGTKAAEASRELLEARADETARVLSLVVGAEMASNDTFAAAILRAARVRGVRPENVRSAVVHSGLGVTALTSNGDKVIVGSRAFLLQEKVSVAIADARASELEAQGRSVLLVALGGRLVGLLALQDGLRPGARAAVQKLHDARIEPVFLSGEARDTCETIARALDIEHVRPEIVPADRGAEVRALADGGRIVAAVGHPSSDDGALGAADVSVAMTAAGAAPGEWGIALASDDVRDATLALTVPRACRERAKTAVVVSAAAHGLSLLGIVFGVAPPGLAPIAGILAAACALALVREPTALVAR